MSTTMSLYYLLFVSYGRDDRRVRRAEFSSVGISASRVGIARGCPTSVRNHRSVTVFPRISKAVSGMYMGRNRGIHGNRSLFVVSRMPFGTTLRVTRTGIRTTRTNITATRLICSDEMGLFSRGIVSRFSVLADGGRLLATGTKLTRTRTRLIGTRGGVACARMLDPISKIIKAVPFHTNTLISPTVPRPLAAISSGSRVCICCSVSRVRLLKLATRRNSVSRILTGLPPMVLRLTSNSVCNRGKGVRAVDNMVSPHAKDISMHTMFPGTKNVLRDKTSKEVVLSEGRRSIVVVPYSTAFRLRSLMFTCGCVGKGTISSHLSMTLASSNEGCVMGSNLRRKSVVVDRKINLVHSKRSVALGWKNVE